MTPGKQNDVVWLDVAMDDAPLMGVRKGVEKLARVRQGGLCTQSVSKPIGEGLLAKGGRNDEVAINHHRIAQRQDVLVLEPRRQPNLLVDEGQRIPVELVGVRHLQRDRNPLDGVVGLVDRRKPSGAHLPANPVLAQHGPHTKRSARRHLGARTQFTAHARETLTPASRRRTRYRVAPRRCSAASGWDGAAPEGH